MSLTNSHRASANLQPAGCVWPPGSCHFILGMTWFLHLSQENGWAAAKAGLRSCWCHQSPTEVTSLCRCTWESVQAPSHLQGNPSLIPVSLWPALLSANKL